VRIKKDWTLWLHEYREAELNRILSGCPEGIFATGLELGAGDGFQGTLLTKYVSRLVETEIDSEILHLPPRESVEYRVCDAEEVASCFGERRFDLVFSSNLLEHLPNPCKALQGMRVVMQDDGLMIHVIPTPFWKFCHVALYMPNRFIMLLERVTTRKGAQGAAGEWTGKGSGEATHELDNNPKISRRRHGRIYHLFLPEPHGVSSGHLRSFLSYRQSRWRREFDQAGLHLIEVRKGPVGSAYGFGLDFARHALERLGFASEYIYFATKKGHSSPHATYLCLRRS
jgi:SAM-dependent methyltransferase